LSSRRLSQQCSRRRKPDKTHHRQQQDNRQLRRVHSLYSSTGSVTPRHSARSVQILSYGKYLWQLRKQRPWTQASHARGTRPEAGSSPLLMILAMVDGDCRSSWASTAFRRYRHANMIGRQVNRHVACGSVDLRVYDARSRLLSRANVVRSQVDRIARWQACWPRSVVRQF